MALHPRVILQMLASYSILQYLSVPLGWRVRLQRPRLSVVAIICIFSLIALFRGHSYHPPSSKDQLIRTTTQTAQYFIDYPVSIAEFGEMGRRVQFLTEAMMRQERGGLGNLIARDSTRDNQTILLEHLAEALFPFIKEGDDPFPLTTLRKSFVPKSRGIVITTGKGTFRYAAHLIANLRDVLKTSLPIQIIYSGDSDLPLEYRQSLVQLGKNIETLDIRPMIRDGTLNKEDPGWAIKPFAILLSKFEQVILIDADSVFLQKPDAIFQKHKDYRRTGTLLFHDRLVGKGAYEYRHEWWRHQMRHHQPSETRLKSVTLNNGYAHEADSGVVVLDKGRLPVLLALLHACWQNFGEVRKLHTYTHTHGDKETYWLGLELTEVPYAFAEHYAAALGYELEENRVCGSYTAHFDKKGKLIWFNGSLLKNKGGKPRVFITADRYMMDGKWNWNLTDDHTACMEEGTTTLLDRKERDILDKTLQAAKVLDGRLAHLINLPPEKPVPEPKATDNEPPALPTSKTS